MKKLIVCIAFAIVSTACVSNARYSALKAQNDLLLQRSAVSPDQAASPAPPGVTVGAPGATTSVMYAREPHGPYQGTVGAQDRHVMKGPKLQLVNHVCANGSRGVWKCENRDQIGGDDYDFLLAFEIDGMSSSLQTGDPISHSITGEQLLKPEMTAYIGLGGSCVVDLTIKAYQDYGEVIIDGILMRDMSSRPIYTKTMRIDACGSTVKYQEITESLL